MESTAPFSKRADQALLAYDKETLCTCFDTRVVSVTYYREGVYPIDGIQARSWIVGRKSFGGSMPRAFASYVDQRGIGISSTRT